MKPSFFIYARKSTDDASRQVRSIGDQIAELRELAERHDIAVVDVLVEKETAKSPGRPVFNEMLDRIETGEASGILAWHPDRLARNSLDGGRIIYLVDTGTITDLKFPTFSFEPTAQGKFMLSVMFGQSKYYVDNLSENIRRGQRQKLKNGVFPQWAPLGYLNDKATRTITVDPAKAPFIYRAFELYATGLYTLRQVRDTVNAMGLTGKKSGALAVSNYQYLLRNPVYYGLIRFNGELYEGRHEPLVSKDLFDRCQEVMGRKSKPKGKGLKPYLYRGVFRCGECGCFITTETQKGHNYLRCTKRVKRDCSQPYVREELVADHIAQHLQAIPLAVPQDWQDWMIRELEAEQQTEDLTTEAHIKSLEANRDEIGRKLDRLMMAFVENVISLDEFRTAKAGLVEQQQAVKEKITQTKVQAGGRFEPVIRFVKGLKQAEILAQGEDRESQRDFFKKTGSNPYLENRSLRVEPRGAWQVVAASGLLAQPKTRASFGRAGLFGEADQACFKRWGWDSNPR